MTTLYSAVGPSARTVRLFIAEKGLVEKGLDIRVRDVDIMRGENLGDEFLQINPGRQLPFVQLDDGTVIAESLAICEYLEELYPDNPLIGCSAEERAETRMWCRRIDLRIMEPSIQGFKASDGYGFFKDRYYLVVNGAEELKTLGQKNLAWLNGQMAGKSYICGERYTLADIQLFSFLAYSGGVGKAFPDELTNIVDWYERVLSRAAVKESRHPAEPV